MTTEGWLDNHCCGMNTTASTLPCNNQSTTSRALRGKILIKYHFTAHCARNFLQPCLVHRITRETHRAWKHQSPTTDPRIPRVSPRAENQLTIILRASRVKNHRMPHASVGKSPTAWFARGNHRPPRSPTDQIPPARVTIQVLGFDL